MQSITISIPNPTKAQLTAITHILTDSSYILDDSTRARVVNPVAKDDALAPLTTRARRGSSKKTAAPEPTVSPDEERDFGETELSEEDLDVEVDEDTETEDESEDEDEETLDFAEVKQAINKWGKKNPKDMTAILLSFNVKTTPELQRQKSKWAPVYRKVMAKLKKK